MAVEEREEFLDQGEREEPSEQPAEGEGPSDQNGEERDQGEVWEAPGPEKRSLERPSSPRDRKGGFFGASSWAQSPVPRREALRAGPRWRKGGKDQGSISRGRIKRIISERGFGFIETMQGEDLFFHCSKLRGLDFASLHENQVVEFDVAQFPQGIQAVNVRPPDMEHGEPEDGWAASSPAYDAGVRAEGPVETGPFTDREALFIRLAVSITRGLEREVQAHFDVARQMGIERSVLSALVERVSTANAEACRAVAKDA